MSAQRRDSARESDASVERMWRVYADQIGIPDSGIAAGESFSRKEHDAGNRRGRSRRTAATVGEIVVAGAAVVVAVASGIVVWKSFSTTSTRVVERKSHTREPAAEVAQGRQEFTVGGKQLAEAPQRHSRNMLYRIPFDFGSDRVSDASLIGLEKVVVSMKANPDWQLSIEGHTDPYGTADHNQSLSERRAQAVKAYLQSWGIGAERLSAVGFGASRAVGPNDTVGNALNRRVEIYRQ
jgi:outer membrane protein OmpA-like peptidoglycan-associated protein